MTVTVDLGEKSYNIMIACGGLSRVGEIVGKDRRVCVVTDDGVPKCYAADVREQFGENAVLFTFPQGEASKTIDNYLALHRTLVAHCFSRKDAIVAVGGGVVGDLAGFAAATYMRGIDFYNVPTTLLSQVDSSVGGKTAVNFEGYKNMLGAFHQPRAVVIDPQTLLTLPCRQAACGLAEALKMAVTFDMELFERFETEELLPWIPGVTPATATVADIADEQMLARLEEVIGRAVEIKRDVVEQDEREKGIRRVLNFGHTLGHAVESCAGDGGLYHGECVAIGMLPLCDEEIRPRVEEALELLGLPTRPPHRLEEARLLEAIRHDKKADADTIGVVCCDAVGTFSFAELTPEELVARLQA